MFPYQAGRCLNCTTTTSGSLFLGEIKGETESCSLEHLVMLQRCPVRLCRCFSSGSRGTATVGLCSVLVGAGMRYLHLTPSPPFSDSVNMGTDYLKKKNKKKGRGGKREKVALQFWTAEDLGD